MEVGAAVDGSGVVGSAVDGSGVVGAAVDGNGIAKDSRPPPNVPQYDTSSNFTNLADVG